MKIQDLKPKKTKVDEAIDELFEYLAGADHESDEYGKIVENISRLQKLKEGSKKTVSPDALVAVGGNLLGLVLVMNYERLNIITSKAFGMIWKVRV